jgi:endonuclease-3
MTPAQIDAFYSRLAAANPNPTTELEYSDPFTLLVAVVLSAQSTDVGVNKAPRGLFAAAPTPEAMLALGEAGVRDHIKTIGLFNTMVTLHKNLKLQRNQNE